MTHTKLQLHCISMNTEITFSTTAKKSETEMTANVLEKNKQEQTLS